MNTRAIMSTMSVPNIPPIASSVPGVVLFVSADWLVDLPRNTKSTDPYLNVVCVKYHRDGLLLGVSHRRISLSGSHMILMILHPSALVRIQGCVLSHFGQPVDCTALTMIRPNERVSPTIAGTNARPMNSLILNVSSPPPMILDPATNRNVKSGENIA